MAQPRHRERLWFRFSVALPLGINGDACPRWARGWNYSLGASKCGPIGAAGASVGKTSIASGGPTPRVAPARAALRAAGARPRVQPNSQPKSFGFGLSPIPPKPLRGLGDEAGDPLGSQEHAQFTAHSGKFVLGAPPRAGAFGHSDWAASTLRRGRRFRSEPRYSLSDQIPAQSSSPCSAQRGRKTGYGFPA